MSLNFRKRALMAPMFVLFVIIVILKDTEMLKSANMNSANVLSSTNAGNLTSISLPENFATDGSLNRTVWCVLDEGNLNKYYKHFPHTLQSLAPCWSYFSEQRRHNQSANQKLSCGFFFNFSRSDFNFEAIHSWAKDLIQAMNCQVIVSGPPPPKGDIYHRSVGSGSWFRNPEDAHQLRNLVLAKRTAKGGSPLSSKIDVNRTLQIGILQRFPRNERCGNLPRPRNCKHFREIANLDKMKASLQDAFPTADVHSTKLKGSDLIDQAWWWYNQDIVIVAHGAALANILFMREKTAAIEIFPNDYAPGMFQHLMKSVGVVPFRINEATSKGFLELGEKDEKRKREKLRNVPLEPDLKLVIKLVKDAVVSRQ